MNEAIDIILKAAEVELRRIIADSEQQTVRKFLTDFYYERKISNFLVELSIQDITAKVFSEVAIRDFILDLTDRCSMDLGLRGIDYSPLSEAIAVSLSQNRTVVKASAFMPEPISQSIDLDCEYLKEIFTDNRWLFYFFIVVVYLDRLDPTILPRI